MKTSTYDGFARFLQRIFLMDSKRFAIWIVVSNTLLWVFAMLAPGEATERPFYHSMAFLGDDLSWAVAFFIVGVIQLLRVQITHGLDIWQSFFITLIDIGIGLFWLLILAVIIVGSWPSISPVIADRITLALVQMWLTWRLALDYQAHQ